MIGFASELERVLGEMASLNKYAPRFVKPNIIGYYASYGIGPSLVSGFDISIADEGKARQAAEAEIRSRLEPLSQSKLMSVFGIDSLDELIATLKLQPLYAGRPEFDQRDRKSLTSQKTIDRIESVLNTNQAGYVWNFVPIDDLGTDTAVEDHLAQAGIDVRDSITFVKTSSSGDVLDADMLFHTAGHAIFGLDENKEVFNEIMAVLMAFGNHLRDRRLVEWSGDIGRLLVIAQFCHFTAAKNLIRSTDESLSQERRNAYKKRALLNGDELIYEMASIFIKRDRVKFAPNEFCRHNDPRILAAAEGVQREINGLLRQVLDNAVGKIISD